MDYSLCENLYSTIDEYHSISTYCTLIFNKLREDSLGIDKNTFIKYFNIPLLFCNKLYIALCGKENLSYEYFEYFIRSVFLQDLTELAKIIFAIFAQEEEEHMTKSDIKLIFIHIFNDDNLNVIVDNIMRDDEKINFESFLFQIKKVNSDVFLIMINYIFSKLKNLYLGYILLQQSFDHGNHSSCNCSVDFKVMLSTKYGKKYLNDQFISMTSHEQFHRVNVNLSTIKIFTAILNELDTDNDNECIPDEECEINVSALKKNLQFKNSFFEINMESTDSELVEKQYFCFNTIKPIRRNSKYIVEDEKNMNYYENYIYEMTNGLSVYYALFVNKELYLFHDSQKRTLLKCYSLINAYNIIVCPIINFGDESFYGWKINDLVF
jgi:hypothetical protein